jgi:DNA-binding response OmpR family regulator
MLKIAVIDEDAAMRALMGEWLTEEGHEVLALPSVAAAPYGRSASDDCRLVILDLVHLRAGSVQAVCHARERFPAAALLGMSTQLGRSLGMDSDGARELGLVGLLAKPCSRDELMAAVAAATERTAAPQQAASSTSAAATTESSGSPACR